MTNKINGTLYTGVTSNIIGRAYQHKNNVIQGFTSRYNCKILVHIEYFDDMPTAITREKQIKAGSRKDKLKLINKANPQWDDLYNSLL